MRDQKAMRFAALKEGDVVAVISYLSTYTDDKQKAMPPERGDLGVVTAVGDCVTMSVPAKPTRETWNFYACYEQDDLRPATVEELVAWELAFAGERA